jgi:very-short-patch-repair endonuclease
MVYKSKSIERTMFYGAKADTFRFAEQMRKNMTAAEQLLWENLKQNKLLGFRFKPQHPVKKFIADFYCHKAKLVVEIDGDIHNTDSIKEHDKNRSYELENLELKVIRFSNYEVINRTTWVLEQIAKHLPSKP